jgi:hypothetical protein
MMCDLINHFVPTWRPKRGSLISSTGSWSDDNGRDDLGVTVLERSSRAIIDHQQLNGQGEKSIWSTLGTFIET